MTMTKAQLAEALRLEQFPRSSAYGPEWMFEKGMGPNSMWLAEYLSQAMELKPGMRVLDLGCGKAMSSIFLAREFGLQVWATDLWIDPSENYQYICQDNMEGQVFPIHADARALPYAKEFFDAIVSIDAYHYFGTDETYFMEFVNLVKPHGQIGIVVPGLLKEFENGVPESIRKYWDNDWNTFHSPDWWSKHWSKTGLVDIEVSDSLPGGWDLWLKWETILRTAGIVKHRGDMDILEADGGEHLGFTRLVARRK